MQSVHGFDLYPLKYDENGSLAAGNEFAEFRQAAARTATDAIFLAHGHRDNVAEAASFYSDFLGNYRDQLGRSDFQEISHRRCVVGAIHWPAPKLPAAKKKSASEKLSAMKTLAPGKADTLDRAESLSASLKNDTGAQDEFGALVLSLLDNCALDPTEGIPQIRQLKGSEIIQKLKSPLTLKNQIDHEFGGDVGMNDAKSRRIGSLTDGVERLLELVDWYILLNRATTVGITAVAPAIRDIRSANRSIKIHLVGHGLGGRLMASSAKSLAQAPMLQPDSMTLLQAAFSHYGFSANARRGKAGFFRDVISKHVIRGPLISTFSSHDSLVATPYAMIARLTGDVADEFGAIGRNGALNTAESNFQPLTTSDQIESPYIFRAGVVNCLDGSAGSIQNHDDISNAHVAFAFASAIASTRASSFISAAGAAG